MLPLIPIAISLASKFAPMLIDRLAGNTAGKVAEQVIGIAQKVSGKADPKEAHDDIMANPELHVEFEKASMNLEIEIAREDTKRLVSVNETMREELKAGGIKGFWRPFNGMLFGITLFIDNILAQMVLMFVNTKYNLELSWDPVNPAIYIFWAGVLGVSAHSRGKEKLEKVKRNQTGDFGVGDIIKTFAQGAIGM